MATFKAKDLHVPNKVYEIFDSFTDRNGNNFTGSLALDGNLRYKEQAAIAMGYAQVMLTMMKIERDLLAKDEEERNELMPNGKVDNGKIFQILVTGLGLSYLLGNFTWHPPEKEGALPALVPTLNVSPDDYETIEFRGGGQAPSVDVMAHLMQHIESDEIAELYKKTMMYNPITQEYSYKSKSGFALSVMSILKMIDEHIADAEHYKD